MNLPTSSLLYQLGYAGESFVDNSFDGVAGAGIQLVRRKNIRVFNYLYSLTIAKHERKTQKYVFEGGKVSECKKMLLNCILLFDDTSQIYSARKAIVDVLVDQQNASIFKTHSQCNDGEFYSELLFESDICFFTKEEIEFMHTLFNVISVTDFAKVFAPCVELQIQQKYKLRSNTTLYELCAFASQHEMYSKKDLTILRRYIELFDTEQYTPQISQQMYTLAKEILDTPLETLLLANGREYVKRKYRYSYIRKQFAYYLYKAIQSKLFRSQLGELYTEYMGFEKKYLLRCREPERSFLQRNPYYREPLQ